jgi:hypothetical protein
MNPYEAPEPCMDEKSQRGRVVDLLFGGLVIAFGPPAIIWLLSCFKRHKQPHTTFTEGVVGTVLITVWHTVISITLVVLIPYLLVRYW